MDKITIKIRQLLETHGKTQKELAEYLGKKQSNMSHMLKYGTFDDKTLIRIAEFFNIHSNELFPQSPQVMSELSKEPITDLTACIQMVDNLKLLISKQDQMLQMKDQLLQSRDQTLQAREETIQVLKQTLQK